jgi:hypothetical protein
MVKSVLMTSLVLSSTLAFSAQLDLSKFPAGSELKLCQSTAGNKLKVVISPTRGPWIYRMVSYAEFNGRAVSADCIRLDHGSMLYTCVYPAIQYVFNKNCTN